MNKNSTRNNGYKLEVKIHTTNTLSNSFNYRVVKIWNSLPSEVVASETVGIFKNNLDSIFENIFLRKIEIEEYRHKKFFSYIEE